MKPPAVSAELIAIIGVGVAIVASVAAAALTIVGLFVPVIIWLHNLFRGVDERSHKQGERLARTEARLDELSPPGSPAAKPGRRASEADDSVGGV
jgi:fatty acid desaturase